LKLQPLRDLLARATEGGYAVPAFDTWTAEATTTILKTAERLRAPVILMHCAADYLLYTPAQGARMTAAFLEDFTIPAAMHLDHGRTMEQVIACVEGGYTSVMLDCSSLPFEENAAALRDACLLAHPKGVDVEGEIGHVGRAGETHEASGASTLTEPQEAADYAAQTGVDALAISIGNAHGQYTALPKFDFERLAQIREATSVPLVLHGGSGTPPEDLRRAISLGISKVNVVTELNNAVRESLMEQWQAGRNRHLPVALSQAMDKMAPIADYWFRLCGAVGKA
jgi:fructose-bisphosphate aldolase class II